MTTCHGSLATHHSLDEAAGDVHFIMPPSSDVDVDAGNSVEIYGALQEVVEDASEDVYTGMLSGDCHSQTPADIIYGKVEPIYSAGGTTADEKRNCVVRPSSSLHVPST